MAEHRTSNGKPGPEVAEQFAKTFAASFAVQCFIEGFPVTVSGTMPTASIRPFIRGLVGVGAAPAKYRLTPDGSPICPKHGVAMRQREKQGDEWVSHVISDGHGGKAYCKGYPAPDSPGYDLD